MEGIPPNAFRRFRRIETDISGFERLKESTMDKYGELYAFSRRKIKKLRNKRVPRRKETDGEAAHGFLSA